MGFDSCQNFPYQPFGAKARAIPAPVCEGKLKPRLEIGKIISKAIDSQFY
jgi:hypothetical protein